jgi:subtilisin family serine protease
MKTKQKTIRLSLLFNTLLLLLVLNPSSPAQKQPGDGFKPDELVCKMQPGYDIDIINTTYGTAVKNHQAQTNCYLLICPQGKPAESLAVVIDAREDVMYCRLNYYLSAPEAFQRSEPFIDLQYSGDYTTQLAATTLNLVAVHEVSDGEDVNIAIIDGGVNFDHPALLASPGEIISGWDFIDSDELSFDEPGGSCSGHGTFVAGIIKLVAPASTLYVYRVLDTAGYGDGYSIAAAVLDAINDSCKVINLSLGMIGVHDALEDALQYARSLGIMVVAAAGNDSTSSNLLFPFPASRNYCLAVAAIDSVNLKADFSNYGDKIDVCAPGTQIYSPYLDTLYAWWDGTSFSNAFVTGLAGLIYSKNPYLTWEEVDTAILNNAINLDTLNPELAGLLGSGLIDILATVNAVSADYDTLLPGDVNSDGDINLLDISFIINFLYRDGPPPKDISLIDTNSDGRMNLLDVSYLINYLYRDGPPPQ